MSCCQTGLFMGVTEGTCGVISLCLAHRTEYKSIQILCFTHSLTVLTNRLIHKTRWRGQRVGVGVGQVPSVLALHRRRALQVSPLQTVRKQVTKLFISLLLAGRVHGWLASGAASA